MDLEQYRRIREILDEVLDLEGEEREQRIQAAGLDDASRALLDKMLVPDEDDDSVHFAEERLGAVGQALIEVATDAPKQEEVPERIGPYQVLDRLGEGGMGVVYSVRSDDSPRPVALKVLQAGFGLSELIKRFEREAKLLGRLRHPGIAAFYDTGETTVSTSQGTTTRHFIAMELVDGLPLDEYAVEAELDDRQRIELLARVADAVHHAHEMGAIHRDLKPTNILVEAVEDDPIGRPKVLDFGVAHASDLDGQTMLTHTGAVVGTLSFMSPEQASGAGGAIDGRADVYSLGVLLYLLLARELPIDTRRLSVTRALELILNAEPPRLSTYSRSYAGDLERIAAMALEKEPHRRYQSAAALAEDLRSYLSGATVIARAPGVTRRVRQWVGRQPAAAAAMAVGAIGLVFASNFLAEAVDARAQARESEIEASANAQLAAERAMEAERQREAILRLSDLNRLRELRVRSDELWPAVPEQVPAMRRWLDEAGLVAANLEQHAAFVAELENLTSDDIGERQLEWWRNRQAELVEQLSSFVAGEGTLASVEARFQAAIGLWQRSIGDYQGAWDEACADIEADPLYAGLELVPQIGLVPLGPNPATGLWEFWHCASGDRPEGDAGGIQVTEEMGLVFVLLPAEDISIGAQRADPDGLNYDEYAQKTELPIRTYPADPLFVSKYEMTQGQWRRLMGSNPSLNQKGRIYGDLVFDDTHPIETITYVEAEEALRRLDLRIPREFEWERAARGKTQTSWWHGVDASELAWVGNVADRTSEEFEALGGWYYEAWRDGYVRHAPVGSYDPNPYGLYDVVGNIAEWCDDVRWIYSESPDDRELPYPIEDYNQRITRGGDFSTIAIDARSSFRGSEAMYNVSGFIGVRPVRDVDPDERGRGSEASER